MTCYVQGRNWLIRAAVNLTAGTEKLFPRSFKALDYETRFSINWWAGYLDITLDIVYDSLRIKIKYGQRSIRKTLHLKFHGHVLPWYSSSFRLGTIKQRLLRMVGKVDKAAQEGASQEQRDLMVPELCGVTLGTLPTVVTDSEIFRECFHQGQGGERHFWIFGACAWENVWSVWRWFKRPSLWKRHSQVWTEEPMDMWETCMNHDVSRETKWTASSASS